MSIDFDLLVNGKVVGEVRGSACFALICAEHRMREFVHNRCEALTAKIDGIAYKVGLHPTVSMPNAHKWIKAIREIFDLDSRVPIQSAASLKKRGFMINGARMSGPFMMGILSLIRYIEEEQDIVNTFFQLMEFEGMDYSTALVLAHGLRYDSTDKTFYMSRPNNANHTIFVGNTTPAMFEDVWGKCWNDLEKEAAPWTSKHRDTGGVFKLFAPKGNLYDPTSKNLFDSERGIYTTRRVETVLNKVIFPARDKFFQELVK